MGPHDIGLSFPGITPTLRVTSYKVSAQIYHSIMLVSGQHHVASFFVSRGGTIIFTVSRYDGDVNPGMID